jgi:hypothetical protein
LAVPGRLRILKHVKGSITEIRTSNLAAQFLAAEKDEEVGWEF